MPAIVIVLSFLVLFLVAFLAVLLGPLVGIGFTMWKSGKTSPATGATSSSEAQICK